MLILGDCLEEMAKLPPASVGPDPLRPSLRYNPEQVGQHHQPDGAMGTVLACGEAEYPSRFDSSPAVHFRISM